MFMGRPNEQKKYILIYHELEKKKLKEEFFGDNPHEPNQNQFYCNGGKLRLFSEETCRTTRNKSDRLNVPQGMRALCHRQ
jgi:hypothetical protein